MEVLATISAMQVLRIVVATVMLAGARWHYVRSRLFWAGVYLLLAVLNITGAFGGK